MKKSKLHHNKSKFSIDKDSFQEGGIMPSIKIKSFNLANINSQIIK